jgi:hypothetical protein
MGSAGGYHDRESKAYSLVTVQSQPISNVAHKFAASQASPFSKEKHSHDPNRILRFESPNWQIGVWVPEGAPIYFREEVDYRHSGRGKICSVQILS